MTTETILTDDQIESLAGINDHNSFSLRAHNDMKLARTIEKAVLQSPQVQALRNALKFYADGEHFIRHDDSAWDTVSGEPQNLYEDEAGTATVEDGTFARIALNAAMEQQT